MESKTTACKNCEKNFDPSYGFCPYCGQKVDEKLTMGVLFHNTVSNYFCVDARFLKSFVPLMAKPGFLPKRFVAGKRHTYLHPAQTYLFISVVFFFLFSFEAREQQRALDEVWDENNIEIVDNDNRNVLYTKPAADTSKQPTKFITFSKTEEEPEGDESNEIKVDSLIAAGATNTEIYHAMGMSENPSGAERLLFEQILKVKKQHGDGLLQAFYSIFPIAMFFLMPIFALLLKFFYLKKGSFAIHMVFSFYFFSFLFVVFSGMLLLNLLWKLPTWMEMLILFSTFFYLLLGVKNFYGESYFLGFIKSSMIGFLFLLLVVPFSMGVMGLIAFMFY